jgi:hypothetical protein
VRSYPDRHVRSYADNRLSPEVPIDSRRRASRLKFPRLVRRVAAAKPVVAVAQWPVDSRRSTEAVPLDHDDSAPPDHGRRAPQGHHVEAVAWWIAARFAWPNALCGTLNGIYVKYQADARRAGPDTVRRTVVTRRVGAETASDLVRSFRLSVAASG